MNEHAARATLGVPASATAGEIKRAYRRRALELHPDRGGDPVAFADLADAQRVLLARIRTEPSAPFDVGQARHTTQPATRPNRLSWFAPSPTSSPARAGRVGRQASSVPTVRGAGSARATGARVSRKSFGEVLAEKLAAA